MKKKECSHPIHIVLCMNCKLCDLDEKKIKRNKLTQK